MDAFDSDVLIYAGDRSHPAGRRVRALLLEGPPQSGVGSVLLLPEILTKPRREGRTDEVSELVWLLSRLELLPLSEATCDLAVSLGAAYGLKAMDASHLATAVEAGADRFITNNTSDFPKTITEIDVTYPRDL